jgi:hypothetical protein
MRWRNGCNFFVPIAAVTEPDSSGVVVGSVIDMVTVGRAKSAPDNIALAASLE